MQHNPVLAEVWRGNSVESQHRGRALVLDQYGNTVLALGDTDSLVFPRSAIKPLQTIPLLESGAAEAFGLTAAHIALTCASHNGETLHTGLVSDMLNRLGLTPEALVCGADLPMFAPSAHELISNRQNPGRQHHNCSGKHSGMLTLSKHMGWPLTDYNHYDHPAQLAWRKVMSELCGVEADHLPWDFDGCGIPALALPLRNLAGGFLAFANPDSQPAKRAAAIRSITAAIQAHPMNIAGTERCCTAVISTSEGRVVVKTGAEGVFAGFIPERKLSFALKIDDGAGRAAETALGGLLAALGEPVATAADTQPFFNRPLLNSQGKIVGKITANSAVFATADS